MSATIADTIYDTLSQQIITGELSAGEKLRQDHIARAFDTSHVPVREALLRLQAHGLAKSEPRRGMRVTPLDPVEVREVIEMRVALEPLALQYAVQNMSVNAVTRAEQARLACDAAETMPEWEAKNRAFHRAILAPCALPRLLRTIDDLHIASARHLFAHWRPKWVQRADTDHAAIMQAIQKKDTAGAVGLLIRHIRRAR
ncbi:MULTISPECIES: GntR family transcriptional regulator [unclassified Ruegeria]|uniref:GntR family transcriptional regulator n=1 Tax=unclassified Ruegeria TaxID=2625375 RepID=UPI001ADBA2F5|nr:MULTISPECIES: GntR family transcriptional regulator [unclassified Ruegeria]MBO9413156.1 GntR family transcriptional regulator [Ruegeria sp. R8_1]MBO9416860.1 GntR family transcriptional regulator [Ruegeria sp. R8_2]